MPRSNNKDEDNKYLILLLQVLVVMAFFYALTHMTLSRAVGQEGKSQIRIQAIMDPTATFSLFEDENGKWVCVSPGPAAKELTEDPEMNSLCAPATNSTPMTTDLSKGSPV